MATVAAIAVPIVASIAGGLASGAMSGGKGGGGGGGGGMSGGSTSISSPGGGNPWASAAGPAGSLVSQMASKGLNSVLSDFMPKGQGSMPNMQNVFTPPPMNTTPPFNPNAGFGGGGGFMPAPMYDPTMASGGFFT